ncbi:chromosome partitioning protein; transcriptional regulator [Candidatus Hydrogenisulfobacillus filiaventi]|uniref:Sporulation initiation inhibitor protein Soj n=1 Tax=Candidatus Hydrogenisulfobacillus filiaventi TaxID=2707344 RepID=A0A6F8ZKQ8_9FIRM|nr:chromosome partitioning protein; transcriptional regulator [Candidatus Hydrogenisulfobacillus filiaventi]
MREKGREDMGRTIAVANQKGGVGKSTTVINLAAYLAESGQRVLAVDADPQGNTTTGLGIDKQTLEVSAYEVLVEGRPLMEALVPTDFPSLHVVPATMDLAGAEVEMVGWPRRERRLAEVLAPVRDRYDVVLIDCPPSLGLLTVNALAAADGVMIPIQCEFFALEGLSQLLATIELVRDRLNPGLTLEGVVLTMFDGRTNLAQQVEQEVRNHFGDKVYRTVIPRTVRLSEAPSHGLPIVRYDPRSRGAEQYQRLAEEVLAHVQAQRIGQGFGGADSGTDAARRRRA